MEDAYTGPKKAIPPPLSCTTAIIINSLHFVLPLNRLENAAGAAKVFWRDPTVAIRDSRCSSLPLRPSYFTVLSCYISELRK